MTQAKIRIDPQIAKLPRTDWERLIYEANLGAEMSAIATRYYINKECQIDIAIDYDKDRTVMSRQIGTARRRIEQIYYDSIKH